MNQSMASLPPAVDRGFGLVVAAWIMGLAGCCLLVMRMYTRIAILKRTGWDDWTMVVAVVLAIITDVIVTLMVHHGVGRHALYLEEEQRVNAVYMIWLSVPFSPGSAALGKISIALFLIRLINRNRLQKSFLWALIFLLVIVNLILVVVTFAQCTPVTFLWERVGTGAHGTCWAPTVQQYYGYFQGAFSAWSDLVLALFPTLLIWKLQIPLRTKLGISFLMSLGVIAAVAATVKTVELRNLATPDFTWDAVPLVYWFLAENWIIIICACVPTVKPLFTNGEWRLTHLFSRITGKSIGSSASGYNDYSEQQPSYRLGSLDHPSYGGGERAS
ncbi:integral membrane protein [Hypoxylon sp. FL0543]|nr:integral membrane protein [Hypoxylon sp. FL0543]